jgi:hypothetical protein
MSSKYPNESFVGYDQNKGKQIGHRNEAAASFIENLKSGNITQYVNRNPIDAWVNNIQKFVKDFELQQYFKQINDFITALEKSKKETLFFLNPFALVLAILSYSNKDVVDKKKLESQWKNFLEKKNNSILEVKLTKQDIIRYCYIIYNRKKPEKEKEPEKPILTKDEMEQQWDLRFDENGKKWYYFNLLTNTKTNEKPITKEGDSDLSQEIKDEGWLFGYDYIGKHIFYYNKISKTFQLPKPILISNVSGYKDLPDNLKKAGWLIKYDYNGKNLYYENTNQNIIQKERPKEVELKVIRSTDFQNFDENALVEQDEADFQFDKILNIEKLEQVKEKLLVEEQRLAQLQSQKQKRPNK